MVSGMKEWDAFIGSRGGVEIYARGFFEKYSGVSLTQWNSDDYITVGKYRIPRSHMGYEEMKKFLKRAEERAAR